MTERAYLSAGFENERAVVQQISVKLKRMINNVIKDQYLLRTVCQKLVKIADMINYIAQYMTDTHRDMHAHLCLPPLIQKWGTLDRQKSSLG